MVAPFLVLGLVRARGAPRLMAGEERSSRLGLVLVGVDSPWLEAGGAWSASSFD